MPDYLVKLDQTLNEDMGKAIPLIVQQVDKERTYIILNRLENLLRTRQYSGATTDYLDGIRECIQVIKGDA
jgi:hypothetical protein